MPAATRLRRGDPALDYALFRRRRLGTARGLCNLTRLRADAERAGIPVRTVSGGNIRTDALDPAHRFVSMPLHAQAMHQ